MSYQLTFEAEPFRTVPELEEEGEFSGNTRALGELEFSKGMKGRIRRHPRFGYVWSGPRSSVSGELAGELEQEIFPPDTRVAVLNTTEVPFRWICRLELEFGPDPESPGNSIFAVGTGTLISPRHVLTAGHNLIPNQGPAQGQPAKTIRVIPGYNCAGPNNSPFGFSRSASANAHQKWKDSQDKAFDFGVITLKDPIGSIKQPVLGGQPLGFWSSGPDGAGTRINPIDPAKLKNMDASISGYPSDKCCFKPIEIDTGCTKEAFAGAQFVNVGKILDPKPAGGEKFLLHRIDVSVGNSGSPIWVRWQQFRNLVGIHIGELTSPGGASINAGIRVTDDFLKEVHSLMK